MFPGLQQKVTCNFQLGSGLQCMTLTIGYKILNPQNCEMDKYDFETEYLKNQNNGFEKSDLGSGELYVDVHIV